MTTSSENHAPIIRRILHPSDFSAASAVAFAHALKAAHIVKGKLALLHVTEDKGAVAKFPAVRETLEQWKVVPVSRPHEAVVELGFDVAKVVERGPNPTEGVLRYLEQYGTDLIVLATHHHGLDWLSRSVSEPVARESGAMTLFVPASGRGFVSPIDGTLWLHNILIPIAETPRPEPALAAAERFVRQLQCPSGKFTLLHVGPTEPSLTTPEVPGWTWRRMQKDGAVIDVILQTAKETNADLIVMTTDGRNGFLDALRGSHSERVLRHAPCPVLAIPEASHFAARLS